MISVFLPFLMALIIGVYNRNLDLIRMFNQGDFILLSYAVTVPILFDLFNIVHKNKKGKVHDARLFYCFCWCLLITFLQTFSYALIKNNADIGVRYENIILTIFIIAPSVIVCNYSIDSIFVQSISNEGVADDE